MVVITDLVDDITDIHPKNKMDVANRLANWALGRNISTKLSKTIKVLCLKTMEINKNKAILFFDNARMAL